MIVLTIVILTTLFILESIVPLLVTDEVRDMLIVGTLVSPEIVARWSQNRA